MRIELLISLLLQLIFRLWSDYRSVNLSIDVVFISASPFWPLTVLVCDVNIPDSSINRPGLISLDQLDHFDPRIRQNFTHSIMKLVSYSVLTYLISAYQVFGLSSVIQSGVQEATTLIEFKHQPTLGYLIKSFSLATKKQLISRGCLYFLHFRAKIRSSESL